MKTLPFVVVAFSGWYNCMLLSGDTKAQQFVECQ